MSKLTHPARLDVDWRQENSASSRSANGVEITDAGLLRTGAITCRPQGWQTDSGSSLLQRWADFTAIVATPEYHRLAGSQKNAAGTENADIQYCGSAAIYQAAASSAIETTLQQCGGI